MSRVKKIPFYDLRDEARAGRLPALIGRRAEVERLTMLIGRRTSNNVLIVGESGLGKTALMYGWAQSLCRRERYDRYAVIQFDSEHLVELDVDADAEERYAMALAVLPSAVVFVDDVGRELYKNSALVQRVHRLYKPLLLRRDAHLVLTLEPHEFSWLEREHPTFVQQFETVALKKQSAPECARVLFTKVPALNARRNIIIPDDALAKIIAATARHPKLGQVPRSAIQVLDESISVGLAQGEKVLTDGAIARVVESKTGIPSAQVSRGTLESVRTLQDGLTKHIVGQECAIAKIASILVRAKLGLRNPDRPLGSFLLLGPSGVGKTETAKRVAELMFGRAESFTRIDMSEFQQEHTVQRLIGAPPGYVGHEAGGALTNALKSEPHSLILLDEIEKAHPKVFDIFLQLLDDARLTSGQGEAVDARDAIIMATSNAAVAELLDAYASGPVDEESLMRERVVPALAKTFRLEFINRFDSILLFRPLTTANLLRVAELEIEKMEKRFCTRRVRFSIEPHILKEHILRLADPRFGARPVKRFVEETCETLVAQTLLAQRH